MSDTAIIALIATVINGVGILWSMRYSKERNALAKLGGVLLYLRTTVPWISIGQGGLNNPKYVLYRKDVEDKLLECRRIIAMCYIFLPKKKQQLAYAILLFFGRLLEPPDDYPLHPDKCNEEIKQFTRDFNQSSIWWWGFGVNELPIDFYESCQYLDNFDKVYDVFRSGAISEKAMNDLSVDNMDSLLADMVKTATRNLSQTEIIIGFFSISILKKEVFS